MNLRRTRAMARKEMLHVVRDPLSLGMALAVPLMMLLLFGYALSLDVDRIPTLIYNGDGGPPSRDLVSRFEASRYFETSYAASSAELGAAVDEGRALLAVWIPNDFSADLAAGDTASVQVLVDGSDSNTASIAMGYVQGLTADYSRQVRARSVSRGGEVAPAVELAARVWYNAELESKNYIVPGLIAVILMIVAALLTSLTVAREYELGNLELLLSTPLRPNEIVIGKMSAYFALGTLDATVAVLVGVFVFQVPFRGGVLELGFVTLLFLFGSLCWGLLLSAAARSQLLAFQIGLTTSFLPAFLLSGFVYAIENMPPVIQAVTHLVPARYFVALLKAVFLKGVSVAVLWTDVAFLTVYAAVVFWLATRQLSRKLA